MVGTVATVLQVKDAATKPAGRVRIQRCAQDDEWGKCLDGSAVECDVIVVQTAIRQNQGDEIADSPARSGCIRIDLAMLDIPLGGSVAVDKEAASGPISRVAVYLAILYDD